MMLHLFYLFIYFSFLLQENGYTIRYDVSKPDTILVLPSILNEISGLTDIDNNYVACTQDELGIIFILDLNNGKIKEQYSFEQFGDFEGLTHVNGSFYILRSDGRITFLPDYKKPNEQVHIKENLPTKNNEGLCYDKDNHQLLIAAKSKPQKGTDYNTDDRLFYKFDIKTATLDIAPVFTLKMTDITAYARHAKIDLPVISDDTKKKTINFRPSSIAVHPVSKNIYIISAADYLLMVCDYNGNILQMEILDPMLYPKAEGITFLNDHTMIITNEAMDKSSTLLKFKYRSL